MRRRRLIPPVAAAAALATLLLLIACAVFARPGGGESYSGGHSPSSSHSYSGGHSPSGGGGGGGNVDIGFVIELVLLCFRYPPLGGAVLLAIGGYYVVYRVRGGGGADWSVGAPPTRVASTGHASVARGALDALRATDPAFSVVLLEDFVYALYTETELNRPRGALERLAAFVTPEVRAALLDPSLEAVSGVIIGALRFTSFNVGAEWIELGVELEVNLTEVRAGTPARSYVVDRMKLVRAPTARSRPPARARKLDCANCGAPLESVRGTRCGYCQHEVGGGRLDWLVTELTRVHTEARAPLLTGSVAEQGTDLPTLADPNVQARFGELFLREPGVDPAAFFQRVNLVFHELGRGWSSRDLRPIRAFVTDNLFQYFGYWIDIYQQALARNVTENARVLDIQLSNVLSDAYYDAVTVRLFATSLDYTITDDGKLLSGSRKKERAYSEYWTLIRGRGVQGRPRTEPVCPSCGAPLRIAMAGNCEYCQARVVGGEFDWVLSRIEQDEAYGG